jgi:hypothetical protein
MKNIKNWWLFTGWPWFKSNWWVVLALPLMALVYVAFRMRRPPESSEVVSDVLKQRLKTAELLRDENVALQQRLTDAETKLKVQEKKLEDGLVVDVEDLRGNPERLRELMLNVGPGGRR